MILLLTPSEYSFKYKITRQTVYNRLRTNQLKNIEIDGKKYIKCFENDFTNDFTISKAEEPKSPLKKVIKEVEAFENDFTNDFTTTKNKEPLEKVVEIEKIVEKEVEKIVEIKKNNNIVLFLFLISISFNLIWISGYLSLYFSVDYYSFYWISSCVFGLVFGWIIRGD